MAERYDHSTREAGLAPVGAHTTISSLSTAQTITIAAGVTKLMLQAFTQTIRYTLDGTTPTNTVGFQLTAAAGPRMIDVSPGMTVKLIQETASATAQHQSFG